MTPVTRTPTEQIEGLIRVEQMPLEQLTPVLFGMTKDSYTHEEVYGEFCNVQAFIDAPPEYVFDFMAPVENLAEWTYSLRDFRPSDRPGLMVGRDTIGQDTEIWCKSVANRAALTVDYHCAWDQGEHLWMIYLNRIVDAQIVFNRPGSVVFWQNCKHPFYAENPFPETAPPSRPIWVGDIWQAFYAGHTVELQNLKRIVEHRWTEEQAG
jgi:hypothetical protein